MASVVTAGVVSVDQFFRVGAFPVAGLKHRAGAVWRTPGGGALIAAAAVVRLGGEAHLAGAVGDDDFGGWLRGEIARQGVEGGLVAALPGVATSRSAILVTPDGERTIINHRDDGLFAAVPTLPRPFPFGAALADTRWPGGAAALMAAAREAGRPGVIDAEAPVALAAEALGLASHVAFSAQGLRDFAGGTDASALARAQARLGVWVAVTRGPEPVLVHDGQALAEVPVWPAVSADTLGAGDVWHAGLALGLAEGMAAPEAVRFASAAAGLKVAEGVLPEREAVEAVLARR